MKFGLKIDKTSGYTYICNVAKLYVFNSLRSASLITYWTKICFRYGNLYVAVFLREFGPLWYILFISELGLLIDCKHLFYADDLGIYQNCAPAEIEQTTAKLNSIIKKI